jgi:hypothetical protein
MHMPPLSGGDVAFTQDHLATRPDISYRGCGSICHDNRRDGQSHAGFSLDPVSGNFTALKATVELSRARRISTITDDRLGTAMASFRIQLSINDIESVVDRIRGTFSESAPWDGCKSPVTNQNIISKTRNGSRKIPDYGNSGLLNTRRTSDMDAGERSIISTATTVMTTLEMRVPYPALASTQGLATLPPLRRNSSPGGECPMPSVTGDRERHRYPPCTTAPPGSAA